MDKSKATDAEILQYISKEAYKNLSLAFKNNTDDVEEQAFILFDGTTIDIKKPINPISKIASLSNPNGLFIHSKTSVKIKYNDDEYAYIIAYSMRDLENKWIKYKEGKGLDKCLPGIIDSIDLTDDQKSKVIYIENNINNILNALLHTNIDINSVTELDIDNISHDDENAMCIFNRLHLISFVLSMISKTILEKTNVSDRIYLPYLKFDDNGKIVEVKDYITRQDNYHD